jgi:DNA-binding transcriptional LysR family regulator
MDRFEALRSLVVAVDEGSFSRAAKRSGVPLPTVSRRIADLEEHLGAQLLVRTSRGLVLTEAGEQFVAATRRLLDDLDDAERAASGEYRAPRGQLVVTAPLGLGRLHVAPIVHDFLAAYPDVNVRLVLSDQSIILAEAHIDLAIRVGHLPDSELVARRMGEVRWLVCGSPGYLERRGVPEHPDDLGKHACIALEGLPNSRSWMFESGRKRFEIAIVPRLAVNAADAVVDAAKAGAGLCRVVSYQAAAALENKELSPVLHPFWPSPMPVHMVFGAQRHQPLKMRAFIDFVSPRLTARLAAIAGATTSSKTGSAD